MHHHHEFLDWIDQQSTEMLNLLETWVNLNSGTDNPLGIREMVKQVEPFLQSLSEHVEILPGGKYSIRNPQGELVQKETGPGIWSEIRPQAPRQVVLSIHLDTVYGTESPFQRASFPSPNLMLGPGTADAKGGLIVLLYALKAFERYVDSTGNRNLGWIVLLNSDEEIGSPTSLLHFERAAQRADFGFLFEPAPGQGGLVSERKGSGNFEVFIQGLAAHAGRDFHRGLNAVVAAAKLAVELNGLNSVWPGVTLNVAKIDGGGPSNIVPDRAVLRMNIRYTVTQLESEILDAIKKLIGDISRTDQVTMSLHGGFLSPPKNLDAPYRQLLESVQECGSLLGLSLPIEPSGGACDGNRLASLGVPNVDTLGVRGGALHSDREYIEIDSLAERAKLTALCLMRSAEDAQERFSE